MLRLLRITTREQEVATQVIAKDYGTQQVLAGHCLLHGHPGKDSPVENFGTSSLMYHQRLMNELPSQRHNSQQDL
jgi:hypothetical protein